MDVVFLHVKNVSKSMEFYSKLLGINYDPDTVNSPHHWIEIQDGPNITLDDHSFDPDYIFQPNNQPLWNFVSEDVEGAYNHIKEIGGELVTGIITWENDFKWFIFKDIDGNRLMICSC
ncbi:VOC family protein [Lederbergia wuyishanensis]